jgi:hypothetical protein
MVCAWASCAASANDFPTFDRVQDVMQCSKEHGGENLDNLYSCSCRIDFIASQLNFDDFTAASTFKTNKKLPGDRGGIFRDSEDGDKLVAKLTRATEEAEKRCFIGRRAKPESTSKP